MFDAVRWCIYLSTADDDISFLILLKVLHHLRSHHVVPATSVIKYFGYSFRNHQRQGEHHSIIQHTSDKTNKVQENISPLGPRLGLEGKYCLDQKLPKATEYRLHVAAYAQELPSETRVALSRLDKSTGRHTRQTDRQTDGRTDKKYRSTLMIKI